MSGKFVLLLYFKKWQDVWNSSSWYCAVNVMHVYQSYLNKKGKDRKRTIGGGGGVVGPSFAGYVPLASQNPRTPIIVYSVASYRPHLSHFWANVIVISRTEFNASQLLNIKTTAGTIFQPRISLLTRIFLSQKSASPL